MLFEEAINTIKDGDTVRINIGSMSSSDYTESINSGQELKVKWHRENIPALFRMYPGLDGEVDVSFENIKAPGNVGVFEVHYFNVLAQGDYVGENLFKREYKTRVSLTEVIAWKSQ